MRASILRRGEEEQVSKAERSWLVRLFPMRLRVVLVERLLLRRRGTVCPTDCQSCLARAGRPKNGVWRKSWDGKKDDEEYFEEEEVGENNFEQDDPVSCIVSIVRSACTE